MRSSVAFGITNLSARSESRHANEAAGNIENGATLFLAGKAKIELDALVNQATTPAVPFGPEDMIIPKRALVPPVPSSAASATAPVRASLLSNENEAVGAGRRRTAMLVAGSRPAILAR